MNRIRKVLMKILATAAVAWLAVNLAEGMDDSLTCVEAEGRPVAISSCLVSGSDVVCEIKAGSVPSSDDGRYYVYANEVYEDGPTGKVVAKVDAGKSVSVTFPLNYNTEESNLSRKFLIAMKKGGRMVQVSDEHYITNPEALAAYTTPRMNVGIKGILPDVTKISNGELTELSVQQVVYNLSVDTICSDASVPGAIPFTYNGKTYYFDGTVISNYDGFVRAMNRSGIQVTMVILNHGTGAWSQDLIHPMAAGGADCPSYALNVANASGTDHLKAIGAFLGQRYSGQQGCGQVDNWIVGNEVNARTSWWYTT